MPEWTTQIMTGNKYIKASAQLLLIKFWTSQKFVYVQL